MAKRDRILEQLIVEPGAPAALADRDPGWTGGPDYAGLSRDELDVVRMRFGPTLSWNSIADHAYDHASQLTGQTFGDGSVSVYAYDGSARMSSVIHKTSSSATAFHETAYTRSNAGDITTMTDNRPSGRSQVFGYDKAHRLKSWDRVPYASAPNTFDTAKATWSVNARSNAASPRRPSLSWQASISL